jgi:uncharacterized SAM-binding protein YcdF (DUF218 family)
MTYIQPLLFVFLALAAIGLWRIPRPKGKLLAVTGVAGIFLISWPPAEWLFSQPLVGRYPVRPFQPDGPLQAIVVFGESVEPAQYDQPYPLAGDHTFLRCEYAVWIYSRFGPLPMLVSGGRGTRGTPPVAEVMRELLRRRGIPDNMIWTEDSSRSTYENTLYSTKVLREHGISRVALVVDAISMPRAAACFHKQQIAITPAPCDFHTLSPWRDEILPSWRSVRRSEDTLHEYLGLLWYRMRGWI